MSENVTKRCQTDPEVIAMLAGGATLRSVADFAGVDLRTVYRWREDAEFVAAVRAARGEILERATGLLASYLADACTVLHRLVTDPKSGPQTLIAAARALLDGALEYRRQHDIEAELARLRARVDATAAAQGQQLPGGGG